MLPLQHNCYGIFDSILVVSILSRQEASIETDNEKKTEITNDDAYTMTVGEDPDDSVFGVFYKAKVILTVKFL